MSIHVGIFGPSLCGKSFVGKALSREAWRKGRASLVCDPNGDAWGAQALVFPTLDERFRRIFWKRKNLSVFIDEATLTIARDNELIDLFTRGRHQGHQLYVLGHRAGNLLPIMRDQFGTLFLFRCSPSDAKLWSEDWGEPRIMEATGVAKIRVYLGAQIRRAGRVSSRDEGKVSAVLTRRARLSTFEAWPPYNSERALIAT